MRRLYFGLAGIYIFMNYEDRRLRIIVKERRNLYRHLPAKNNEKSGAGMCIIRKIFIPLDG
jgi:hypothetical protein